MMTDPMVVLVVVVFVFAGDDGEDGLHQVEVVDGCQQNQHLINVREVMLMCFAALPRTVDMQAKKLHTENTEKRPQKKIIITLESGNAISPKSTHKKK